MKSKHSIIITKASGLRVPFNPEKLKNSLRRSGADELTIEHILSEVENILVDGMSTRKIYQKAFGMLKRMPGSMAAKYKLKKAIMELGPSGYPFEKYFGNLLATQGYDVQVSSIVEGHCVKHEVDVIAKKDHDKFMIECKFHGNQGNKCDIKVPLYIYARFKDIEKKWLQLPGHDKIRHQGWLVTNTRFTSEAIQYGNCMNLQLVGWDYPKRGSLKERIDVSGLHPITCLTTLKKAEKRMLLDQKIVLCKEIANNSNLLSSVGIRENRIPAILKEVHQLCM